MPQPPPGQARSPPLRLLPLGRPCEFSGCGGKDGKERGSKSAGLPAACRARPVSGHCHQPAPPLPAAPRQPTCSVPGAPGSQSRAGALPSGFAADTSHLCPPGHRAPRCGWTPGNTGASARLGPPSPNTPSWAEGPAELSGHWAPYRAPRSVLPAPKTAAGHWGMCVRSHTAGLAVRLLGGSSPWNCGGTGAGSPSPAYTGALLELEIGVLALLSLELCWSWSLGSQPHSPPAPPLSRTAARPWRLGAGTGAVGWGQERSLRHRRSAASAGFGPWDRNPAASSELLPLRAAAARPSVCPSVKRGGRPHPSAL